MTRELARAICVCTMVLLFVSLPAVAAEGRFPLWTTTALGPGSTPGQYIVTRDIAAPAGGGPAIAIAAGPGFENVEIDLNGFTITGDPAGGSAVIDVGGMRSVTIRNGTLQNVGPGTTGISASAVQKVTIEDVTVLDGDTGFFLRAVPTFAVRRNEVVKPVITGILVDGAGGAAGPVTGTIEDNQVKNSVGIGIEVRDSHAGVQIVRNRVENAAGPGIHVATGSACLVSENTVRQAGDGILLESIDGCKVHNNVTSFNLGFGINAVATFNSLFLDNVASNNGATGIETDGERNQFDRNVASDNACNGLRLVGRNNLYGRNSARFNLGGCGNPCAVAPVEVCSPPYGGGSFAPDLCVEAVLNTSLCDNMMPGPPRS